MDFHSLRILPQLFHYSQPIPIKLSPHILQTGHNWRQFHPKRRILHQYFLSVYRVMGLSHWSHLPHQPKTPQTINLVPIHRQILPHRGHINLQHEHHVLGNCSFHVPWRVSQLWSRLSQGQSCMGHYFHDTHLWIHHWQVFLQPHWRTLYVQEGTDCCHITCRIRRLEDNGTVVDTGVGVCRVEICYWEAIIC